MVTLRCTQKLLKRIGVKPVAAPPPPTTVLGDWYANLLYTRPQQLVLCMNERSLLVTLIPARDIGSLGDRIRESTLALLLRLGVARAAVEAEGRAMAEIAFAPTASRSVLGCMREVMRALDFCFESQRFGSLAEIDDYFSEYIYAPTDYQQPRKLVRELFAAVGATSSKQARSLQ